MDPAREVLRLLVADNTPLIDTEISPAGPGTWKFSGTLDTPSGRKFKYKDKTGGTPVKVIKILLRPKDNLAKFRIKGGNFDLAEAPDQSDGVLGLSVGGRCFMEPTTNCTNKKGKLTCKAEAG